QEGFSSRPKSGRALFPKRDGLISVARFNVVFARDARVGLPERLEDQGLQLRLGRRDLELFQLCATTSAGSSSFRTAEAVRFTFSPRISIGRSSTASSPMSSAHFSLNSQRLYSRFRLRADEGYDCASR